jgi:phage terminase small subunit
VSPHRSGSKPPMKKDVDILFHTLQLTCERGRLLGDVKGTIVEGTRGGESVKSPAWVQFRETSGLLLKVGKELGLTPSSRLRMPNPFDPDDDDDELERLLTQPTR